MPDVSWKKRTTLADSPTPEDAPTFDHSEWDAVLRAHVTTGGTIDDVTDVNLVDYEAMANDGRFTSYLKSLAAADVESLPVAERLALWMNAYNALCISLLIEQQKIRGAPVASINDLSTKKASAAVGGEPKARHSMRRD